MSAKQRNRPCFGCGKTVTMDHCVSGGTEFTGSPGFGSDFDSVTQAVTWQPVGALTPQRTLTLIVCDACLKSTDRVEVCHRYETVTVREENTKWTGWPEDET